MTAEGIILSTVGALMVCAIGYDIHDQWAKNREFRKQVERQDAWIAMKREYRLAFKREQAERRRVEAERIARERLA